MNETKLSIRPGAVVLMLVFIVIIPLLPLLISRRWDWWEAWVYAGINIIGFAVSRRLAEKRNPGIIAERGKGMNHEDAKDYDRILAPVVSMGGAAIPLIAGFDELLSWSGSYTSILKIISIVLILAAYVFGSWALIENRFFSGMVRIQADRGHHVISGGPYRLVRHPGYAGSLITYLFIPFLLDSSWAFIPSALLIIALIIRTHLEDETLKKELTGYDEYAKKVRYRLIPGLW